MSHTKKRIVSLFLSAAVALSVLAVPAFAAEEGHSFTFAALGDSITAGVGLSDLQYDDAPEGLNNHDMRKNYEGYSSRCYVALVAEGLGLDRQHALDLGLPGLMSGDLAEIVRDGKMSAFNQLAGSYYDCPEIREYLRDADVVSVQIGSNDALVRCIVALGEATNWKSEQLAGLVVSGLLRDHSDPQTQTLLQEALSSFQLTWEETGNTLSLLFNGMDEICEIAYPEAAANLDLILEELHTLNPDAHILLMGYTNPVPLIPCWSRYFDRLNRYEQQLADRFDYVTYVPIPQTQTALDGHPTEEGHRYIAEQIVEAIRSLEPDQPKAENDGEP